MKMPAASDTAMKQIRLLKALTLNNIIYFFCYLFPFIKMILLHSMEQIKGIMRQRNKII